jgi:predicted ArsR family transcriptional regulator
MSTDASADRILFLLKTRGARTAQALAETLGMTAQGARQHLGRLQTDGLVEHEDRREKVGRPTRYWSLTAAGHARFPDSHAALTVDMIEGIRRVFGPGGLDRLIADREARQHAAYDAAAAGAETLEDRIAALTAMREREGYMAEWRRDGDGWLLVENHCPICAAAEACSGFCRSELALFRMVLGEEVVVERTDHILAGARRCAYRITPVHVTA